jgi:hypothetical protein
VVVVIHPERLPRAQYICADCLQTLRRLEDEEMLSSD